MNIDGIGEMHIRKNFSGRIEGQVDSLNEMTALSNLKDVKGQVEEMTDTFRKSDDKSSDCLDGRGIVGRNDFDGITTEKVLYEYEPETNNPKMLKRSIEVNSVRFPNANKVKSEMNVDFDKEGNIQSLRKDDFFKDHRESLDIKADGSGISYNEEYEIFNGNARG